MIHHCGIRKSGLLLAGSRGCTSCSATFRIRSRESALYRHRNPRIRGRRSGGPANRSSGVRGEEEPTADVARQPNAAPPFPRRGPKIRTSRIRMRCPSRSERSPGRCFALSIMLATRMAAKDITRTGVHRAPTSPTCARAGAAAEYSTLHWLGCGRHPGAAASSVGFTVRAERSRAILAPIRTATGRLGWIDRDVDAVGERARASWRSRRIASRTVGRTGQQRDGLVEVHATGSSRGICFVDLENAVGLTSEPQERQSRRRIARAIASPRFDGVAGA